MSNAEPLKRVCAPAHQLAPVPCRDRRMMALPSCRMLNYSAVALPLERIRGEQCSESLSEEQYVLHRYFGGSTGTPKRGGVFFELGAFDGWQESNTLHLENCLAWTGVLVDAPTHLDSVRTNRPNAISVGLAACPRLGLVNYSMQKSTTAGISSYMNRHVRRRFRVDEAGAAPVACGPLSYLLSTLGLRHIDFLSLDVQGAELMVLRSIDWAAVTISVLVAECKSLACRDPQDAAVRTLLESPAANMRWDGILRARHDVWDAVFVSRTLSFPS